MAKTLSEYLQVRYPVELVEEDGGYFVRHPDLDGCMAQGSTVEEALSNLEGAREIWIAARLEDDLPVPEPSSAEPSGRLLLRMPPWLHARLVSLAQRQRVSLNQLITSGLAEFVGGAPYRLEADRFLAALARLERVADRTLQQDQSLSSTALGVAMTRYLPRGSTFRLESSLGSGWTNLAMLQHEGQAEEEPELENRGLLIFGGARQTAGRRG
jgi:antitoxin HicB